VQKAKKRKKMGGERPEELFHLREIGARLGRKRGKVRRGTGIGWTLQKDREHL